MLKRFIGAMVVVVMLVNQSAFAAGFTDITNHWAKDYITSLADAGVVNGVTDTQFMPESEVTRAQYLKMIMEATGVGEKPVREGECLDAASSDWYGTYLQGALDCGLIPKDMVKDYKEHVDYTVDDEGNATYTKVTYSGAFMGNQPINREEMAVLTQYMYQYIRTILTNKAPVNRTPSTFSDEDKISDWAKTSVNQAVANGFMDGMDNNMFNPEGTATRAQAAAVIWRVRNK